METVNRGKAALAEAANGSMSVQDKRALAYAKKGILFAVISGIIFSTDGLLVAKSGTYGPFANPDVWLLAPFICAGLHDLTAAIITTFVNIRRGRLNELGRSLVSKPGRYVLCGAIIGAIFGMGGYMLAVKLAGPAYILPITSLYPAIAAVLAVFVLKEKISARAWAGLVACVVGAVVIGYTPPGEQVGTMFYLGLGCAALAAFGWGTEGVLATSGMDFIEPVVALNMYYIVSTVLYCIIIIPVLSIIMLNESNGGFSTFVGFFTNKGIFFIMLAGCVGSISYQCWYRAMNMTGVSRAMAINISYALWGIVLSSVFTSIEITNNLIFGAIIIFFGMFLVIGNPKDMINLRKVD